LRTNAVSYSRALKDAYKLARETLLTTARKAMKLKGKAEEEAPWETYEERFNSLPDDLDALHGKIENNKAALECFRGDRTIREVYERVCSEIIEDEARLEDLDSFVTHGEDRISGIKVRINARLWCLYSADVFAC
jgi:DNA repair exonuclease SbcCD ATPase subunit